MTLKTLVQLFAIAVLIIGGVFVAVAQDDDNPIPFGHVWMHNWDNENFGPDMMHGHGMMMGGGFGPGMMWGDGEPMMYAIAEALDLEPEASLSRCVMGKPLQRSLKRRASPWKLSMMR